MNLTRNKRKLLLEASLLLSKIGASTASEEIDYVLEADEFDLEKFIHDFHLKQKTTE